VGFPTAALTETGELPTGVTFVDKHDGTATIAGTPAAGSAGVYHFAITASNGIGAGLSQAFSLTINAASTSPAITGAGSTTFRVGQAGSFRIDATGTPTPAITEVGALPAGVTFVDNGNGTATLAGTPAAGAAGVYHLTIIAANGVGNAVTEDFTLDVVAAPRVTRLQRVGTSRRQTRIVLSFDQPMDAASVQDANNYDLRPVVGSHVVGRPHRWIRVTSAVYDAASQTVSLRPAKPLPLHRLYQITVNGLAPSGLMDTSRVLLDGQGDGQPGNDLVLTFGRRASLRGISVS